MVMTPNQYPSYGQVHVVGGYPIFSHLFFLVIFVSLPIIALPKISKIDL